MNGPAVAVELSNQHAVVISCQLQVVLSSEIITLKLNRFILSVFSLLFLPRQQNLWVVSGSGSRPSV